MNALLNDPSVDSYLSSRVFTSGMIIESGGVKTV
jgi:hypothetical protein